LATTTPDLALGPAEQEVLAQEIQPFAAALRDPAAQARYAELAAVTAGGSVPEQLVPLLEAMLELVLQTQRVRRQHGPAAERALQDLFRRTPRGRELQRNAHDVNTALKALSGQVVQSVKFSPTPGGQRLVVITDECQLGLTIDRSGVRLERLEI
jgi:hypothetical protein